MVDQKVMQAVIASDLKQVLTAATNTANIAFKPSTYKVSSLYDPKDCCNKLKGECYVTADGQEAPLSVVLSYTVDNDGKVRLVGDHTQYAANLVNCCSNTTAARPVQASTAVMAAGDDFESTEEDFGDFDDTAADASSEDTADAVDALSDAVDELQETVDEVEEDDPNIEMDNNIENHYIAECDRCHGVFISALTETDHEVASIKGICPLCEKESEQQLKWIVRSVKKEELL